MRVTPTQLRRDLYRILDRVLQTGTPVEIDRDGNLLKIVPVERPSRLDRLVPHPGEILVDPEELVEIDWSSEWKPFI
jgi:antitoxin (DNA-binding transcriptional repressor) of toxin-antitoxin stability system